MLCYSFFQQKKVNRVKKKKKKKKKLTKSSLSFPEKSVMH